MAERALVTRIDVLCAAYLRPIAEWQDLADGPTPVFVPPLTAPEQAVLADLVRMARFGVDMTLAEWQSIKAAAAEIRTFRTRTAAEWSALTAAQRDNALIQWCADITDVLRALLRD